MRVGPMRVGPMTADVRRILVGLDGSVTSREALEVAARLAQVLEAELEGLFVEEEAWHRVGRAGGWAGVQLIGAYTGTARSLEGGRLGQELRSMARRMARHLEELSIRTSLRSRFRVERGRPETVLLAAATEVDLVTVGRVGRSRGRVGRLGTTARTLVEGSTVPLLLLPEGTAAGLRLGGRVVVVLDAEEVGAVSDVREVGAAAAGAGEAPGADTAPPPALDLAAHLARSWEGGLEVILPRGADEETAARIQARIEALRRHLTRLGVHDAVVRLAPAGERAPPPSSDALVILERGSAWVAGGRLEGTLASLRRVAVLLV